jgi:hypothetical protein
MTQTLGKHVLMHKLAIMLIDTLDFALLCITNGNQLMKKMN